MRNPRRLITLFIAAFLLSTPMFAATVVFVADYATMFENYPNNQTIFHHPRLENVATTRCGAAKDLSRYCSLPRSS